MARITKNPDERRNEILDTALELFMEKSFEETAVSDIVKKIGVAQGTFYYYFKSKEEVLGAIIERVIYDILSKIDDEINNSEHNGLQKFKGVMLKLWDTAISTTSLSDYVHTEKNAELHHRVAKELIGHLVPEFERIIKQGVAEGLFNTDYPLATPEFIVMGLGGIHEKLGALTHDEINEEIKALEDIMERCLGADKGSIRL